MIDDQPLQETQIVPQPSAPIGVSAPPPQAVDSLWLKFIPNDNKFFLIISSIFVFGVDLLILIGSPSLFPFWAVMLIVFGVFILFWYFENVILSKQFAIKESRLDVYLGICIIIRNVIFLLNFIPVIQVIGMMLLVFGGIPFLVIYFLLLGFRLKN